ncbi:hypothetical protein M0R72_05515 [Candidatus Pacearchaeota archaeon]|jgi:hypothetical protein|nr:hypothetical protein [Candidatus Pacearchaeota archaeon]
MANLFRKLIIESYGRRREEKELIVNNFPIGNRCDVACRKGNEILIKEYHYCGGGELSEVIRSKYNQKDSMYQELNKQLLAVGL